MAIDLQKRQRLVHGIKGLRGNFYGLLVSLLLLIFGYPFLERTQLGNTLRGMFVIVILIMGVYSLSRNRRFFYIALGLAFPALAGQVARILTGGEVLPSRLAQVTTLLFFLYVTLTVLALVLKGGKVTADKICGAASVYLLMGVTWMVGYTLVYAVDPGAFTGSLLVDGTGAAVPSNFFYYSFVTLTTLGYGDIQPVSVEARTLSILESVCGVLYIAILISRLVAMYEREPGKDVAEG